MKNKKIISLLIVGAMSLSLSACSSDTAETLESEETKAVAEIVVDTTVATSPETSAAALPDPEEDSDTTVPAAYRNTLARAGELIDLAADGDIDPSESEGAFWGLIETVRAFGTEESRENICYALKDVNEDGVEELIIACRIQDPSAAASDAPAFRAGYSILCVFTMNGDEAVLLADSYSRAGWLINSDGQFLMEGSSGAAYHDLFVYELEEGSSELNQIYHLYTDYVVDTMEVILMESTYDTPAVEISRTDDPAGSDIWDTFDVVRAQYTENMLMLDLSPVYGACD